MRVSRAFIAVVFALVALGAATATPASAASCARAVINDWYKHGSVTGQYPIHCYSEALANLPEDVHQYSNAPDDIRRAMLLALRGDSSGGTKGPGGGGGPTPTGFGTPTSTGFLTAGKGPKKDTGFINNVFGTFGPKNASSIPLPLIILAAVALLLLAAGAASFVARRLNARRIDPPRPN